jgi:hypothetical protein
VNATIKAQNGYDPAAVATAATQVVTAFLQPYSWPWTNTLRYNQLLAVLAQVPGVLYVVEIAVSHCTSGRVGSGVAGDMGAGPEGLEGLADRSHRPSGCPHQMPASVEAAVLELRRERPYRLDCGRLHPRGA